MHKFSFVAGLVIGGTVALGLVISVPELIPAKQKPAQQRVERQVPTIVVSNEPRPLPVTPPAVTETKPKSDADEWEQDAVELSRILLKRRARSNETAAIATLRNITSAQAQFQATARADENQNGVGEYGSFAELSGAVGVREGRVMNPPVLSSAFRRVENGRVFRSGYYYRIFLMRADRRAIGENDKGGFLAHEVDPRLAETTWCAYAWPEDKGEAGGRTFFVNQMGDILGAEAGAYGGDDEPAADAAFEPGSVGITGRAAIGKHGCDRNEWKQVN